MADINLLPTEITPKGFTVRLAQILRNVATVGLAVLLISGVGMGAFFILTSVEIRSSTARQDQLKTTVKSLESTEQSLILLKDRVGKVKQVLGADTVSPSVQKAGAIITSFPPDVAPKEIQIGDITKITVTVSDTSELVKFMSALMAANKFKRVDLKGFSFSPTSGYLVSIEMADK